MGFYISSIQVNGQNSKPAKLSFERGFNVITGLSDTGKSYVFACINYMLGGANPPKAIPESIGYTGILLEIKRYSGETFTLYRDMMGGQFSVKEVALGKYFTSGNATQLKAQHVNSDKNNISDFLLQLSGFEDKYVRINRNNQKRELSYRDIAGLTSIDEERVITEKSPVYSSGQYNRRIQEQSVLEILLTGKDAKDLKQIEDVQIRESRVKGKIELVDLMIQETSKRMLSLEKENPLNKMQQVQDRIDSLSKTLEESSLKLEALTTQKQILFESIQELNSKNLLHNELAERFSLLKEHYNSDIKRLEFVTEGEQLFTQLKTIKCPICGGDLDKEHYDCITEDEKKSSSVINAIEKEIAKIKIKLNDLEGTIAQLSRERHTREIKLKEVQLEYKGIEDQIQNNVQPLKSTTKNEIDYLLKELSSFKEFDFLKEQVTSLFKQRSDLERELLNKIKVVDASVGVQYTALLDLCNHITSILTDWKYPNVLNVNFNTDYNIFDFVINNKNRNAHGKGIRAITYSAFVIGLMNYCAARKLPHSYNVIIDSPLTTYHGREATNSEDISKDMQDAFFNALSKTPGDRQIIIFDNKEPLSSLQKSINYIHFTNDKLIGRQGFFPS